MWTEGQQDGRGDQLQWQSMLKGIREQESSDISLEEPREWEEKQKVPGTNLEFSVVVLLRESVPSLCKGDSAA